MKADKNVSTITRPDPVKSILVGWRRAQFRRRLPLAVLLLAFVVKWLLLMNVVGPTWDAAFYYSYARSLVYDQDLSLENDLVLSYPTASDDFVARNLHTNKTKTGSVYAPFAVGSGLLWLPFLATLRLVAAAVAFPATSGFEWFLVGPVATFSAITGLITFYISYRIAVRETGLVSALLAALTMSFATPLIYYQFREPLYAHLPSALLNTVFVYAWWRSYRQMPSTRQGLLLGAMLALAALMRWQNVIYASMPLFSATWSWLRLPPDKRRQRTTSLLGFFVAFGAAFLAIFSFQLLVWQLHYGSWFTVPQGTEFMTWRSPFLREILFSSFRGLLPWMPIFGLASIGLLLQVRRNPRLVLPLIVLVLISTYVNASSRDWFAGGGYGPRRSTGEVAILILGYAWLLQRLPENARMIIGSLLALTLTLHQWLLLRFGLGERIGGSVVSMAPEFEWVEHGLAMFVRQLAAHVPDLILRPGDVFILSGSPLHRALVASRLPEVHVVSLLAAVTFTCAGIWLGNVLHHRLHQSRPAQDERPETKKAAQA